MINKNRYHRRYFCYLLLRSLLLFVVYFKPKLLNQTVMCMWPCYCAHISLFSHLNYFPPLESRWGLQTHTLAARQVLKSACVNGNNFAYTHTQDAAQWWKHTLYNVQYTCCQYLWIKSGTHPITHKRRPWLTLVQETHQLMYNNHLYFPDLRLCKHREFALPQNCDLASVRGRCKVSFITAGSLERVWHFEENIKSW